MNPIYIPLTEEIHRNHKLVSETMEKSKYLYGKETNPSGLQTIDCAVNGCTNPRRLRTDKFGNKALSLTCSEECFEKTGKTPKCQNPNCLANEFPVGSFSKGNSKYCDNCMKEQQLATTSAPTCSRNGCSKPRWRENNGKVHPFCGRTCANTVTRGSYTNNATASVPTCSRDDCNRPCYYENGKYHDYCGRTCAKLAGAMRS